MLATPRAAEPAVGAWGTPLLATPRDDTAVASPALAWGTPFLATPGDSAASAASRGPNFPSYRACGADSATVSSTSSLSRVVRTLGALRRDGAISQRHSEGMCSGCPRGLPDMQPGHSTPRGATSGYRHVPVRVCRGSACAIVPISHIRQESRTGRKDA